MNTPTVQAIGTEDMYIESWVGVQHLLMRLAQVERVQYSALGENNINIWR